MSETKHARIRAAQRCVSEEQREFAIRWGREIRQRSGRVAYHLGRREVAFALQQGVDVPLGAEGVAVVLGSDGGVVTVLRSHDRRRLARQSYGRRRGGAR